MADPIPSDSEQTSTPTITQHLNVSDHLGRAIEQALEQRAGVDVAKVLAEHLAEQVDRAERVVSALERIAAAAELMARAGRARCRRRASRGVCASKLDAARPALMATAPAPAPAPTMSSGVLRQAEDLTRPRRLPTESTDRVPRGFTPDGAPIY